MAKLEWSYHRAGCKTCGKTQDYLAKAKLTAQEEVNARKERMGDAEALELLSKVERLHVTRGKKVLSFDLRKDTLSQEELLKLVIGPSGNLRAPTLKVGKDLLVGFDEEMYKKVLK